jgi:hypothetical protein
MGGKRMTGLYINKLKLKIKKAALLILVLPIFNLFVLSGFAQSQEIYIISNVSLQISLDDVKGAYLGRISKLDGEKIILLEPPAENPAKQKFLEKVLGMDIQSYRKLWLTKLMAGETPPQVKSEDEIIKEVSEKKTAVGYVSKKVEGGNIKIIGIIK